MKTLSILIGYAMVFIMALAVLALLVIGWKIVLAGFVVLLLVGIFVFVLEGGQACLTAAGEHYTAWALARRNKKAIEAVKEK